MERNIRIIARNFKKTIIERDRYIYNPECWDALNAIAESLIPSDMNGEELREFNLLINQDLNKI